MTKMDRVYGYIEKAMAELNTIRNPQESELNIYLMLEEVLGYVAVAAEEETV